MFLQPPNDTMSRNSNTHYYLRLWLLLLVPATLCTASVVEFGSCHHEPTNTYRCARNQTNCETDEAWKSPLDMRFVDGLVSCGCAQAHVGYCSSSHGSDISDCRTEVLACPGTEDTFTNNHRYFNDGSTCLCTGLEEHVYSENSVDFVPTLYGACRNDDNRNQYCVMHSWDCAPGETWLPPTGSCTCDVVRVGACYHPLGSNCAVDADSCATGDTFLSPKETQERQMDCFLCSSNDLVAAEAVVANVQIEGSRNRRLPRNQAFTIALLAILANLALGANLILYGKLQAAKKLAAASKEGENSGAPIEMVALPRDSDLNSVS